MRIDVLSVFPHMLDDIMAYSIPARACAMGYVDFHAFDLRTWTHDRHHSVDDAPYGGGQGMLMKCTPFFEALDELCPPDDPAFVVMFTPAGTPLTQDLVRTLSEKDRLMLVCGHYEGMDERCFARADLCLSLGDYVLSGGELAAAVLIDAVIRLIPGVLGDAQSPLDESFQDGLLEYAQYTRPADVEGACVPEILLSGDHAKIAAWRRADSIVRTCMFRPDLIASAHLSPEEAAGASAFLERMERGEDPAALAHELFGTLHQCRTR